ncbi:DUF2087 domain-containing protein [Paenibacillus caseinilyticus]|uniref:DUF2087 domain-containing protein n=1 Tax=Paenibacillus mucilaginosus K02 TaxID=997761 RepID=I0BHM4_9BACL|nr:DUF2087 domain-containing protein [Paenibacillus mucilaginosus]AFH61871.1 hypothetical protein B2K_14295 [Paenibacillus mucilaginosus K02]
MKEHQPSELLWSASQEELKKGYRFEPDSAVYRCLACSAQSEQGIIYPAGEERPGLYLDAGRWMKEHIASAHGSMMHYLSGLDKKWTGLSDLQRSLLLLFHEGHSDAEIVKKVGGGSASTIRNHRFMLREKEKQARLFLAMMELLRESKEQAPKPSGAAGQAISPDEELPEGLGRLFPQGAHGPLKRWPGKESLRIRIAGLLAQRFEPHKRYSEKEVNDVLEQAWPDYAVLRRYMVEYGFMERKDDGSAYWLAEEKESTGTEAAAEADSGSVGAKPSREKRKELVQAYQETERPAGVFRVINRRTGRMLVGSSRNLGGMKNRIWFQLESGSHPSKELQEEFRASDGEGIDFEVLEELPLRGINADEAGKLLAQLEAKWMDELKPYGERGYHPEPREGGSGR